MAVRQDGKTTKQKLLQAAARVFAEKGYRDTTVCDICQAAEANVAAVNYHFGSKDELYAEVWQDAHQKAMEMYPPDGGLDEQADAEQKLRALIRSLLYKTLGSGVLGYAGKILLMEMANPTEALREVKRDVIGPLRRRTERIVKELLGEGASEQQIFFCELSVIHQVLFFGLRQGKLPPRMRKMEGDERLIDALADHITSFSLAGIADVRRQIASR